MNTHQTKKIMLFAGLALCLLSCNNSTDSKTVQATDSTSTTTTTATGSGTAASTIVTSPENILVVRHKVANFDKWKMAYDGDDTARRAHGVHNYVVARDLKDPNMVIVAMKIDDTAQAMRFVHDPNLKKTMTMGGVTGTPEMSWYTAVWQDTATIQTSLRSSATFMVKDWNNWEQHFKQGDQERTSNGVMIRSYGHDLRNPNKVRVVSALIDSAKAMAYFNSDLIRKRMDSAGVTGKPDRIFYRIVQRY